MPNSIQIDDEFASAMQESSAQASQSVAGSPATEAVSEIAAEVAKSREQLLALQNSVDQLAAVTSETLAELARGAVGKNGANDQLDRMEEQFATLSNIPSYSCNDLGFRVVCECE